MELFIDTRSTPAAELFIDTRSTPAVELLIDILSTPAAELLIDTLSTPAVKPMLQTLHETQHSFAVLTFTHSASPSCMKTVTAIVEQLDLGWHFVAHLDLGWHCGTARHKMALWYT